MSLKDVVAPALANPGAADYAALRQAHAGRAGPPEGLRRMENRGPGQVHPA